MATERRLQKIREVAEGRQKGFVVVLENVHDPHNAEAVLRTCDCFGVGEVCLIFETERKFNAKQVGKRTSGSANKWLTIRNYQSTEQCLSDLKKDGYTIYATTLIGDAKSIFKESFLDDKIALVMGNEHAGISDKVLELADKRITIPMQGMVQSLNISVAAAIFVYEIARQRKGVA